MKKLVSPSFLLLLLALPVSYGYGQVPFYQGKTITIVAGTKAGDVYDLYARLFAQHLPKYIPGNPNIIVQNMPGAASMIAANHVYNVAAPDGLTIGAIFPALYFDQIVGRPEVKFDWSRFIWLGSPVTSNHLLYMRADTPYRSIADVVNSSKPPKCGATGTSSTAYYIPKLLEETVGTRFDIVLGYQSGQDIDLAVERGELVCRSFTVTAFFAREPFTTWRKKSFVRVLMQTGRKRDARLPDTPTIYELMDRFKTPAAGRSLATLVLAASQFGRPYVLPPNTPAERVKIIRDAFEKALKDEAVVADGTRRKLEFDPTFSDELEQLAKEVTSQPPEIVGKMKQLLKK
ncbi:MAG TPA: tripartite tricarboxylate transporter substrate-binding protein [candidate division Zixibacteria bacterium]|nr:tripartite tricarboxylate transporter substrate-binding protein [candidate division Zixibacteria bacterium]